MSDINANYPSTSLSSSCDFKINKDHCVKCRRPQTTSEKLQTVKERGIQTIIDYSIAVNDQVLHKYLTETRLECSEHVKIHRDCQRQAYNMKRKSFEKLDNATESANKVMRMETRGGTTSFDWKSSCFFCDSSCLSDRKHGKRSKMTEVKTLEIRDSLLKNCSERNHDEWAANVKKHLLACHDLIAAKARYHKSCYDRFRKKLPKKSDDPQMLSQGRPVDKTKFQDFDKLCHWLESESELHSLLDMQNKLIEIAGSEDVYDTKWIRKRLEERYGNHIYIGTRAGRPNIVCLRNIADYVINDKWYTDRLQRVDDEAKRIISTAAKLILGDIRSAEFDCNYYPSNDILESTEKGKEWLPPLLRLFLERLIRYQLHQVSIGHCIMNVTRPRSCIPPIPFGLGIEVENVFGSKWLLNELSALGFSVSSDEVLRYKQSVTENENTCDVLREYLPGKFTQWMADNVDHNPMTLDGKGSLHAMGCVSSTIFERNVHIKLQPIKRQKRKLAHQIIQGKGIPVVEYMPTEKSGLSSVFFKPLLQLQMPYILPPDTNLDLLWHTMYFFGKNLRSSWSGFMTMVTNGDHPGKATISYLPILDMDPSDLTCIYSVLVFILKQAEQMQVKTPVVTFDQPLWLKAMEIVKAKSLPIVLILGGFHLMMSFLGSVGTLMKGSGLTDAFQAIYGSNAVEHIMTGKAVSRALRAHFLTESALTTKLLSKFIPKDVLPSLEEFVQPEHSESKNDGNLEKEMLCQEEEVYSRDGMENLLESSLKKVDSDKLKALSESVMNEPVASADHVATLEDLEILTENLQQLKDELCRVSRTSKLWIQYISYIEVLKLFIRAERTGNWNLHLVAISKMINLFAATGHINYAKCARLHLQNMMDLPVDYPWVYKCFAEQGCHTVRRSDRYWAGLWSDLIIEQCLMRSLKSRGGITRGRGITESVRQLWVSSMHRCASVHDSMGNLTGQHHKTSEQHIELGTSRIKRDNSDLQKLVEWFDIHNPFDCSIPQLRSLTSGLTAVEGDGINCDDAENVGYIIQQYIDGLCIEEAKIKRSGKIRTLESLHPGVKLGNKVVHIDPLILFTRLTAMIQRKGNAADTFCYELTPEPTSLFADGMMRKTSKSVLRNYLLEKVESSCDVKSSVCIVDGGKLLHKVRWPLKGTYGEVIEQYLGFLSNMYGRYDCLVIVFDGYTDKWSLKSHEHHRRGQMTSSNVALSEDMNVTCKNEVFFRNQHNKQQFISLLSCKLQKCGYETVECTGDADIAIVKKAIDYAGEGKSVVVAADDTDILVLLIYHWKEEFGEIYFSTEQRKNKTKVLKWWNIGHLASTISQRGYLLFAHAWSGCDTTSATYMKGELRFDLFLKIVTINTVN